MIMLPTPCPAREPFVPRPRSMSHPDRSLFVSQDGLRGHLFLTIGSSSRALSAFHETKIECYPPPLPFSGLETVPAMYVTCIAQVSIAETSPSPDSMYDSFRLLEAQVKQWGIPSDELQLMVEAM